MTDGLKTKHRAAIIDALAANDRVERAVLFGSRAAETHTFASDVDIALVGDRLTPSDQARLDAVMEELTVPQRVDLLLYATIDNDALRHHIDRQGIEWYRRRGSRQAESQGLLPRYRDALDAMLQEWLPDVDAWAYGRSADSSVREQCDLYLVLRARDLRDIPDDRLVDLRQAVHASSFSFTVNAYDCARLPDRFHRAVELGRVALTGRIGRDSEESWPTVPLGQVAELALRSADKQTKPDERTALICDCADAYSSRYIRADLELTTTTATEHETRKYMLQPGDVIIPKGFERYGDIGAPALVRDGVSNPVCGCRLAILRPVRKLIHGPYLFYALQIRTVQDQFRAFASGAARLALRKDDILRAEIPLPPLPEQHAIAHLLGTLDDKIAANRRINATLEAMAQSVFRDWFVEFGPVRARIDGREPYLVPGIWNLFPDNLSGDTQFPDGWELSEIGKEVETLGGATPGAKEPAFLNEGADCRETPQRLSKLDPPVLPDAERKIASAGVGKVGSGFLPKGALLVSPRDPSSKPEIAQAPKALNRGSFAMICNKRLPNLFVLFWCREHFGLINGASGGSAFAEIDEKTFGSIPVIVPSVEIIDSFERIVCPLLDRIAANTSEIDALAQIRDLLIPRLALGKVVAQAGSRT